MADVVDLEEIKSRLIDKLKPSGWAHKLRSFVQSQDFSDILQKLYDLREAGHRFTPPLKHVFKAFEECPIDQLKVVVIGQDPYPFYGVADGIAFSCSITGKPQPSLKEILGAVNRTVYEDEQVSKDVDLTRWANQGVLLLNAALTCEINKPGSHTEIWKDFIAYVMDMLSLTSSGLVFILMGKTAQEFESIIGPQHYVFKTYHPAYAIHTGTQWDCQDVFNRVNVVLKQNNGESFQINW